MDPELQRKIDEARAQGYSDEEIQQYLGATNQGTEPAPGTPGGLSIPANAPVDRSEEQTALMQGAGMEAAKYAAGVGAAGYGLKKVADIVRGPVAPPPEVPPGATQRAMSSLTGGASRATVPAPATMNPPTASPSYVPPAQAAAAQEAQQISRANQIVRGLALDRLMKASAGIGMATYSGGLNTNEDQELARRRAREVEQARQMGWIK